MLDMDDKTLVIMGVVLLGLVAMFVLPSPASTVNQIITGLFGVAVGRGTR